MSSPSHLRTVPVYTISDDGKELFDFRLANLYELLRRAG